MFICCDIITTPSTTVHNLPLDHFNHLVKTVKEAFPDSEIAQSLKMSQASATYHLKYGLAETEVQRVGKALSSCCYAAALDGGCKGNKKRIEIYIR